MFMKDQKNDPGAMFRDLCEEASKEKDLHRLLTLSQKISDLIDRNKDARPQREQHSDKKKIG
jgi:hypothetical protein